MPEWVKVVHSLAVTVAGIAITTILIYRAGVAFYGLLVMVKDRLSEFLSKLETAFDRTRERDRGSDSWRRRTTDRLEVTESRIEEVSDKCDRLIRHLLPPLPTATAIESKDQPQPPGDH